MLLLKYCREVEIDDKTMKLFYFLIIYIIIFVFVGCKSVQKKIPEPPLLKYDVSSDPCDSTNYVYHPEHAYQIKILNDHSLFRMIYNNLKAKEKIEINKDYKNQIVFLLRIETNESKFAEVEIMIDKSIKLSQKTVEKITNIVNKRAKLEISCSAKLYYRKFKQSLAVIRWDFQKNYLKRK